MKTILYMGAGASAEAIPVVNETGSKMDEIKNKLIELIPEVKNLNLGQYEKEEDYNDLLNELIENLAEIIKQLNLTRLTIDSLMFKYYNQDKIIFKKMKATYAAFLTTCQVLFGTDSRYTYFFSQLARQPSRLNDFRVISWNYDLQWEASYYRIHNSSSNTEMKSDAEIRTSMIELNSMNEILNLYGNTKFNNNNFGIYKLNGSLYRSIMPTDQSMDNCPLLGSFLDNNITKCIKVILTDYLYNTRVNHSELQFKFHFENTDFNDSMIKSIHAACRGFANLTIIGYSFPNENRDIDKEVFKPLTNNFQKIKVKEISQEKFDQVKDKLTSRFGFKPNIIDRDLDINTFIPNNYV